MSAPDFQVLKEQLLRLAESRGEAKSFCPSEVARALAKDWRPLMPLIRIVGAQMVREGDLRCTQKGEDADAEAARGAVRFSKRRGLNPNPPAPQNGSLYSLERAHE